MSREGLSPEAYLVIDNSMLSTLTSYYCHGPGLKRPAATRISSLKIWISEQLEILTRFTPDGLLHCTDCVAEEFRPAPILADFVQRLPPAEYRGLQDHVCSILQKTAVDRGKCSYLRTLPGASKKLVGPGRLSDNDLSLVLLGAGLTALGEQVYILSQDQDLLEFVSWVRTKPDPRNQWHNLMFLQAYNSLHYLDLIHRACNITTDLMKDLLMFALLEHYGRQDLLGTQKGQCIMNQLLKVNRSLVESAMIKQAKQAKQGETL
jgi:hypothetical protein